MKHTFKVTMYLIMIFLIAQIVGLLIINEYVDVKKSSVAGDAVIKEEVYHDSIGGAPPPVKDKYLTVIFISISVLVGTLLLLVLIKYRMGRLMKGWFFMAIVFCLSKAFYPFILRIFSFLSAEWVPFVGFVTILVSMIASYLKLFRSNVYVHNITEIFLYGGLAAFVVPSLNLLWAAVLLVIISIYDAYAVWQSKHMVKMAKYQSQSKMFAGLMINYKKPDAADQDQSVTIVKSNMSNIKADLKSKDTKIEQKAMKKDNKNGKNNKKIASNTSDSEDRNDDQNTGEEVRTAILGGGDIAFPLLFTSVLLMQTGSFLSPLIVTGTTAFALFMLLLKGESNKFYPAMPFISAGCFLGYGLIWIFGLV